MLIKCQRRNGTYGRGLAIPETVWSGYSHRRQQNQGPPADCAAEGFAPGIIWPAGMKRRHVASSDKLLRESVHPVAS